MNNISTAMLIIFSEIGLVLFLVFIIVAVFFVRRRIKDTNTSHQLIETFKNEYPERKNKLTDYVKNKLNIPDEEAGPLLDELLQREKSIYSHTLKIFSGRDRGAIVKLNDDIKALTEAYQSIAASSHPQVENNQDTPDVSSEELEVLKKDKERLQDELKTALESIDRLQKEYQNLYEKNKGDAE
jgi:hypothetical protein